MVSYLDELIAGTAGATAQRSSQIIDLVNKEFYSGQMAAFKVAAEAPEQLIADCNAEIDNIKSKLPKEDDVSMEEDDG